MPSHDAGRHSNGSSIPETSRTCPGWFWEAYPALLSHPALRARLRVYELVYRLAELTATPDVGQMLDVLENGTTYERFLPSSVGADEPGPG